MSPIVQWYPKNRTTTLGSWYNTKVSMLNGVLLFGIYTIWKRELWTKKKEKNYYVTKHSYVG